MSVAHPPAGKAGTGPVALALWRRNSGHRAAGRPL